MTRGAKYRVGARRSFRGHAPGTVFEAVLDPAHELRALVRGDIEVIERVTPSIRRGGYTLPVGWANPREEK